MLLAKGLFTVGQSFTESQTIALGEERLHRELDL
jgi:hypothetical protein